MNKSAAENGPNPDSGNQAIGLGLIKVSGTDRQSFLQGQLTQDVDLLRPATPLLTGWANPKGRLRCLSWMVDWQDAIWLLMPAALVEPLIRQLTLYVLRADVQIAAAKIPVSACNRALLAELPEFKGISSFTDIPACFTKDNYLALLPGNLPDTALLLAPTDGSAAVPRLSWAQWRHVNILAGIPSVWPQTSGEFVPQMLNLELLGGISFTKGCYVGQEIAARTQNLGRIKRRMLRFSTPGEARLEPGSSLYSDGAKAGQVVDAVSTAGQTDLLAVISLDKLQQTLTADAAGHSPLSREPLPYIIPELPD
jgi:folate-binding protein YgfZ